MDQDSVSGLSLTILLVFLGFIFAILIITAVVYLFQRRSRPVSGMEEMIGLEGVVRTGLSPEGMVFVRGELWRARPRSEPLPAGTRVKVVAVRGLTLIVERAGD